MPNSKTKIAVILFPGTNCEIESKLVAESVGMNAEIVRWNSKASLSEFDGFILPGGFSYEDRIRAGIIAAKDKIMLAIKKEAENGKPVIGICNGAQILVESGLIPNLHEGFDRVEMALAPNVNPFVSGYFCSWVYVKSVGKSIFNSSFSDGEVFPIPIAHGEGRFVTANKSLIKELQKNSQIAFQYCDKDGNIVDKFPVNPNGSTLNIAAVTNKRGNVMAIMPHPERASFRKNLPDKFLKDFADGESFAHAIKVFEGMKKG